MPSMANNELREGSEYLKLVIALMLEKGVKKKSEVDIGLKKLMDWSVDNDFAPPRS